MAERLFRIEKMMALDGHNSQLHAPLSSSDHGGNSVAIAGGLFHKNMNIYNPYEIDTKFKVFPSVFIILLYFQLAGNAGRNSYQYLPIDILETTLAKLTKVKPPRYGEAVSFHTFPGIQPFTKFREQPPPTFAEHYANAAEWALPSLLSWLPVVIGRLL